METPDPETESTCVAVGAGGANSRGGRVASQGQASRGPTTEASSVGSGRAIGGVVVHLDVLVQPPRLHLARCACGGQRGLGTGGAGQQGDREGDVGGLGVGGGVAGPGETAR